uniref:CSON011054 protein n=1 Tax=Culicoides sonorensis TaxID=179676 RepID=A0A336MZU4_CULSO
MKHMIDKFAEFDLFGRENYEYYARVTGRVLRVQDEWFCSFRYPPPPSEKTAQQNYALQLALETEKTWLQCECERLNGLIQEESQSTPALLTSGGSVIGNSAASLALIPEHSLLESCARLSVSLEGPGLFNVPGSSTTSCSSTRSSRSNSHHMTHEELEELRNVNRYAESTKSLSYLPQVHERQTARMRTRSEWFLGARGSSLELSAMSSTPVPGSLSANIGSYNFYTDEIDVVNSNHNNYIDNVIVNVNNNRNALSASAFMLNTSHSSSQLNHHHHHHLHHHHYTSATNSLNPSHFDPDDQSTLLANSISIHESQFGESTRQIATSEQSSLSLVVFTLLDFLF